MIDRLYRLFSIKYFIIKQVADQFTRKNIIFLLRIRGKKISLSCVYVFMKVNFFSLLNMRVDASLISFIIRIEFEFEFNKQKPLFHKIIGGEKINKNKNNKIQRLL